MVGNHEGTPQPWGPLSVQRGHLDALLQLVGQDQHEGALRMLDQAPLKKALTPSSLKTFHQRSIVPMRMIAAPLRPTASSSFIALCKRGRKPGPLRRHGLGEDVGVLGVWGHAFGHVVHPKVGCLIADDDALRGEAETLVPAPDAV